MPLTRLSLEVISNPKDFEKLEADWHALQKSSSEASFFLTWEWLYQWWQAFGGNNQLNIVVVRDREDLCIAIAPFYIRSLKSSLCRKVLSFLGTTPISSDYLDIICTAGLEKAACDTIAKYLIQNESTWDYIDFHDVLVNSLCNTHLKDALQDHNYRTHYICETTCPYLDLPATSEILLSSLSSRLRSTVRRKLKKTRSAGIIFHKVTSSQKVTNTMLDLFRLHKLCWNERGLPGTLHKKEIKQFHQSVASTLEKSNQLALYTLKQNDETIAILYGFDYGNKISYFQSGFLPSHKQFSPGTVLMWHAINDAIESGAKTFDFLRGDEPYKSMWTKTTKTTKTFSVYSPTNTRAILFFSQQRLLKGLKAKLKHCVLYFQKILPFNHQH